MQTSSTARFAGIPLAVIVVLVAGMAGGLGALIATENLPGQGGSSSLTVPAPVVLPSTGEGSVSPRHIEGLLGSGAMLNSRRPIITGTPFHGQGEGLVGPGATLDTEIKEAPVFGPGDGLINPVAKRGGTIVNNTIGDRADGIGELGKPSSDEYVAGSHQAAGGNEVLADDSSSRETEFIPDPHRGGITD